MGTKRTRKVPLTSTAEKRHCQPSSHRSTQATISSYHTLLKRQAQIERRLLGSAGESQTNLREELGAVKAELQGLGGLETYQDASKYGQSTERGGDSAKVLIAWLRELGYDKRQIPTRILEIGALTPANYAACSKWIENHPIDLHSQHPDILEQDFFLRPPPPSVEESFDVVSCSLVLNFVPEPKQRGLMLKLIREQLRPQKSSLLYLVLPLPCVHNSRYLDGDFLEGLMRAVGFTLIRQRWKEGGKVGYWLWAWQSDSGRSRASDWQKKQLLQDGPKRNNFAVVLP